MILFNLYFIAELSATTNDQAQQQFSGMRNVLFLGYALAALIFTFSEKIATSKADLMQYCGSLALASSGLLIAGTGFLVLPAYIKAVSSELHLISSFVKSFTNLFLFLGLNALHIILAIVTFESIVYCIKNRKVVCEYFNS